MALNIIMGSPGTGKTYYLYKNMTKMAESGGRYFAVVPEQYTMETQRKIVDMTMGRGTMNIDIVSFNRLADRLFEERGANVLEILDDTGKCMVLRKVMENRKDELGIFKTKISYPGFVDEIKSLISEFYQYGIDESTMEQIIDSAEKKPLLRGKMEDIKVIAQGFREYLRGHFIVSEEIMSKMCLLIPDSHIIKGSVVSFDGFTGFTALQYNVIEYLMQYAKDVAVTLTGKKNPANRDLFTLSDKTINKLESIALEHGIEVKKIYMDCERPYRYRNSEALCWMEKNLFAFENNKYDGDSDSIKIFEAANPGGECEFAASKIDELVRKNNLRYRDVAVITGDMESYYHGINETFQKYKIPCFIDFKNHINNNPFIESIKALLETVDSNYSYENMFRLLRCGMMGMENDDADRLENYVLSHGIKSFKRWNEQWKDASEELLALRDDLLMRINPVYEGLKDKKADVRQYTRILYEFVAGENMQEKLKRYEIEFEEEDKPVMAKEYSQVYKKVMELFDKTVMLLGNEKIKLREYIGILEAGFQEIKIGTIPPTMDCVIVGDMERTRLGEVKVLFFMGVNDGIIPKTKQAGGILSETDRKFFEERGVELAPSARENVFIQRFYLYLNLTKMSEKLILSYSRTSSLGKTMKPSYIIRSFVSRFENLRIFSIDDIQNDIDNGISTRKNMELKIADGLRDYVSGISKLSEDWKEMFGCFDDDEKKRMIVSAAYYYDRADNIDKAVAKTLYGNNLRGSVSRLETFAACAYRHFMLYGLNIVDREKYEVSFMDIGNFYHKALEKFSESVREEGLDWRNMEENKREELVDRAVEEVSEYYRDKAFYGTARDRYLMQRMSKMTDRTTWALCRQLERGEFVPEGFEVDFDGNLSAETLNYSMEGGAKMNLRGSIDRIDIYETDDSIYVKIVDYKSGNKKFDVIDVFNGLQLQLILYMEAAMDMVKRSAGGKKVIPAGVFYYDIKNPVVDESDGKEIQDMILEELKPDGIIRSDEKVIYGMDKKLMAKESGASEVIPVSFTGKGLRKTSSLVSGEQFDTIISYVHRKAGNLGKDIIEGHVEKNPYKKQDGKNPCEYCEYKPVCRFDTALPGNTFRNISGMSREEIWKLMEESDDENAMD